MPLSPGAHLGPYEILSPLGAGGMGEVYRARDPRLGRDVAIKVLPDAVALDPDRLRRFEHEARASGALNHPGVLVVLDVGSHGGAPFIVSELLEGQTLRDRLRSGSLPLRKALDYGVQIARGLSAAHEKGIVHRDLKPENLFLTRDGRVKILDFGLAKLRRLPNEDAAATGDDTATHSTDAGSIVGTASYMSPEQVRGLAADHRSDIFSFGIVLYEMLSRDRPFKGETSAETMTAILKQDPPELSSVDGLSPALDRVIRHCLEKDREGRFHSAHDLALALEALSGSSSATASGRARALGDDRRARLRRRLGLAAAALAAATGIGAGAFLAARASSHPPLPHFEQLTFRRGFLGSARFASDGQTIVYSALWGSEPRRLFSTRAGSTESRLLDVPNADILSISSRSEMALLLHAGPTMAEEGEGTLAVAPLAGGAPRELLDRVVSADWSPDGSELAVIRSVGTKRQLEYPVGTVLYEDALQGIFGVRVSRSGDLVAFAESGPGDFCVIDREKNKRVLAHGIYGTDAAPFVWSVDGKELWWSGREIRAVSMSGVQRPVHGFPPHDFATLLDVARDGRVLMNVAELSKGMAALAPGARRETDLSWQGHSIVKDLTADGSHVLFNEVWDSIRRSYLQPTDGSSPPVLLGDEGRFAEGLSADGKLALLRVKGAADKLDLVPTGAGETRTLRFPGLDVETAGFFPDNKRLLLIATPVAGPPGERCYLTDIDDAAPRAVTPAGTAQCIVSPDGNSIVALGDDRQLTVYPLDGKPPWPVPGPPEPGALGAWSPDGRGLIVGEADAYRVRLFFRDLKTGERTPRREIVASDPAGLFFRLFWTITPDEKSYAYSYWRSLGRLYLVEDLR